MERWSTPFLSVLKGTDKDALQQIFTSLQAELGRLTARIGALEAEARNTNKIKEQRGQ
jgi:hypothetical protein